MDDYHHFSHSDIVLDETSQTGRILLKENSSYIICGRSGSGKTTFIASLLENIGELVKNDYGREIQILYCYSAQQPLFEEMNGKLDNLTFHKGIPSEETIDNLTQPQKRHLIIVIDDLMRDVVASNIIFDFFTVKAHHLGCTIIYVSHNLYQQGKFSRAITLNASYIVLFQNPRWADQIQTLSRQIFPGHRDAVVQAYNLAMKVKPYSYLMLDMTANIPDELRMRTCILPGEMTRIYF